MLLIKGVGVAHIGVSGPYGGVKKGRSCLMQMGVHPQKKIPLSFLITIMFFMIIIA